MTDYGSDVSTYPDLDATFGDITGPVVVAECVARLQEQVLRGALNADLDPRELRVVQAAVRNVATDDERVQDATVSATLLTGGVLECVTRLVLVDGEVFAFTLRISDVTAETIFGVQ